MFNQIRASIARAIAPRASLPGIGTELPQIQLVTRSAQVATAAPVASAAGTPGQLIRANPADLASTIEAVRVLRTASPAARRQALAMPVAARAATLSRLAPGATKPTAKSISPEVDDDDLPAPPPADDGVAAVIKQLESALVDLKKIAGETDDSDDEVAARAALLRGDKATALKAYDRALCAVGAKIQTQNSRLAARAKLFGRLNATCAAPLAIEASDNLDQRRAKARKNMFRNLQ